MYQFLKSLSKKLIPRQIFRQYERVFRMVIYLFYKGNKFQCNICLAQLKSFIKLPNNDLLCPKCGSLPRTRRLFQIVTDRQLLKGKVLHFSPPQSLSSNLNQNIDIQYISSDYEDEFTADQSYDLTQIALPDNQIDLFIVYHVFEHIEADISAMKELYRITKKGGKGLIQTPFTKGKIYENYRLKTEQERLKHFGQKDHVRIYSIAALQERLESVGFLVEVLQLESTVSNRMGFKMQETVLIVVK